MLTGDNYCRKKIMLLRRMGKALQLILIFTVVPAKLAWSVQLGLTRLLNGMWSFYTVSCTV